MRQKTLTANKAAKDDLLVINGIEGSTPYDLKLSRYQKHQKKPSFDLVKKTEKKQEKDDSHLIIFPKIMRREHTATERGEDKCLF